MEFIQPIKIQRLWGFEWIYQNGNGHCLRQLMLIKGYKSSLHRHRKAKTLLVSAGILNIALGEPKQPWDSYKSDHHQLISGESVFIPPFTYHRIWSETEATVVVEASTDDADMTNCCV